jgi:hypothetical protein
MVIMRDRLYKNIINYLLTIAYIQIPDKIMFIGQYRLMWCFSRRMEPHPIVAPGASYRNRFRRSAVSVQDIADGPGEHLHGDRLHQHPADA